MSALVYDENFIRNFLKKTIEEIDTPFIERRINSGGTKENIQDEIVELLSIINENEEQIKTLVQLGYYLVEKGQEDIQEKQIDIDNLQQQIIEQETQIEFQKQSFHEYQKLYYETLDKNNKLQSTIVQIESESSNNLKSYESIKNELQKLRNDSSKIGKPEDIDNLKQNLILHQQENLELKNLLTQSKTENKQQREELTFLTKTQEKQISTIEKIEYEIKNQKNINKTLEFKAKEFKNQIQKLEELCSIQIKEIEELKKQNISLEKDVATISNRGNQLTSITSPRIMTDSIAKHFFNNENNSDGQELLDKQGNLPQKSLLSSAIAKTYSNPSISLKDLGEVKKSQMQIFLEAHGNLLSELKDGVDLFNEHTCENQELQKQSSNHKMKFESNTIKSTSGFVNKPRRDPYEEFFVLTAQCVKLNSPYMDDILALDTSKYYKQAIEQYIPYHKWYTWIEDKLNSIREILLQEQQQNQLFQVYLTQQ